MGNRIVDGFNTSRGWSCTICIQHLECHDFRVPADTGDADFIIPYSSDDARTVGAVAIVIHRVIVTIDKVISMVAASIVPHICRKVVMQVVNTRVYHRNHNRIRPDRDVPCIFRTDIGTGSTPRRLTRVLQPPLKTVGGIIRHLINRVDKIGLGIRHARLALIVYERLINSHIIREGNHLTSG